MLAHIQRMVDRLPRVVERAVGRELRAALLMRDDTADPAPPRDLRAQEAVLGALLDGRATPSDLTPLVATHMWGELHQVLYDVLGGIAAHGRRIAPEAVYGAFVAQGYGGARVAEELVVLAREVPAIGLPRLRQRVVPYLVRLAELRDRIGAAHAEITRAHVEGLAAMEEMRWL